MLLRRLSIQSSRITSIHQRWLLLCHHKPCQIKYIHTMTRVVNGDIPSIAMSTSTRTDNDMPSTLADARDWLAQAQLKSSSTPEAQYPTSEHVQNAIKSFYASSPCEADLPYNSALPTYREPTHDQAEAIHDSIDMTANDQYNLFTSTTSSSSSSSDDTNSIYLPSTPNPHRSSLHFAIHTHCRAGTHAKASTLYLPHGAVNTPTFMPVGTQGAIKGLTSEQMSREPIDCRLLLANTYHLSLRPGADAVAALGGIHAFANFRRNVLTDSGGFQMVSLAQLSVVSERGVEFESPFDSTQRMMLTPEKSIRLQNLIGADIIMALDDVISTVSVDATRFAQATRRTIRWIDRCIAAHARMSSGQSLFGIIQGGVDPVLRQWCLTQMMARDAWLPGYAIGGLAGGEDKSHFWRTVKQCATSLRVMNKPIYCMGVGHPIDLIVCVAFGVDLFDCVWPCRTARFGSAITSTGIHQLRKSTYKTQLVSLDSECDCLTCTRYTRAHLSTIAGQTTTGCHLLTLHNLTYMKRIMQQMRQSIVSGQTQLFVKRFCHMWYAHEPNGTPQWVRDAFASIDITIRQFEQPIQLK